MRSPEDGLKQVVRIRTCPHVVEATQLAVRNGPAVLPANNECWRVRMAIHLSALKKKRLTRQVQTDALPCQNAVTLDLDQD